MRDFFTKQEKILILFLLAGITVGAGIELYQGRFRPDPAISQPDVLDEIERQIQGKAGLIDSIVTGEIESSVNEKSFSAVQTARPKSEHHSQSVIRKILIEINTANAEQLVQLPQVGPVLAKRIIEYRMTHGPFKRIDELRRVKGIGEKKLNSISPFIYIKSE